MLHLLCTLATAQVAVHDTFTNLNSQILILEKNDINLERDDDDQGNKMLGLQNVGPPSNYNIPVDCRAVNFEDVRMNVYSHTKLEDSWALYVLEQVKGTKKCPHLRRVVAEFALGEIYETGVVDEYGCDSATRACTKGGTIDSHIDDLLNGQNELIKRVGAGADCSTVFMAPLEASTNFHSLKVAVVCDNGAREDAICREMTDWYAAMRGGTMLDGTVKAKPFNWDHGKGRGTNFALTNTANGATMNGGISEERCAVKGMVNRFEAPVPHGRAFNVRDPQSPVSKTFQDCGAPWIGGMSGTMADIVKFAVGSLARHMDDKMLIQFMAQFILGGHHSLTETATVAQHYAHHKNRMGAPGVAGLTLPFAADANSCPQECKDFSCYYKFMWQMCKVAEAAFGDTAGGCVTKLLEDGAPFPTQTTGGTAISTSFCARLKQDCQAECNTLV